MWTVCESLFGRREDNGGMQLAAPPLIPQASHTVPMGLPDVAPVGPAMPLTANATSERL